MAETRRTQKTARSWPKRGEIYLTALGPALIVQNDTSNRYSAVTMVAPIVSPVRLPLSPLHVELPARSSTGLAVASVAVFNQIWTIDRRRLVKKLGAVDARVLTQVDDALKAAFGLTPELDLSFFDTESAPTITDAISASTEDFKTGRYQR